jgi:ferritin-like metal-binding protein YciE
MPDPTRRELKLIQYLNEAYSKEKELETALEAHIAMTSRPPYKKRLQEHLKETKAQARNLERRIKKLGGSPASLTGLAKKAEALAKGPLHTLRGAGGAEKMLKNAKTEYFNEAEEIATYHGIEALADALGDKETVKLAKEHRRQEERMAKFLERLIPTLTKAVVTEEIPARERKPEGARTTRRRRSTSRKRTTSRASSSSSRPKRTSSGGTRKSTSSRGTRASRSSNGASASRSSSGSSSRRRTTARSGSGSRRS